MVKLLDYSSQDDDVSPSIFHDNCEEIIAYIENLMRDPKKCVKDDDLNDRYNLAAKNSLVDMDWRVLKYGENILLGEIKKLVDLFVELCDKFEGVRKRAKLQKLRASSALDNEMKRLSQVIEDLDSEIEPKEVKKPKLEEPKLRSPVFTLKKVKPVNLTANLETKSPEIKTPEEKHKDESTEIFVKNEIFVKDIKNEFWNLFKDDSEWWKALAKRNIKNMEETRRELDRFSGHELVLGEYKTELNKYEKDKETLQSFIDEVDKSKAINKDLEYDKKYEDMVLKLIEFAKKDFIYKGFDPLIDQLKALSNIQIENRKKKVVNIQDIINIYTQIDISKYTYEELCLLEKYYKEIIRKYKSDTNKFAQEKENIKPRDNRSPSLDREETQSAPPSYNRNVILNVHSKQNLTKNINHSTLTLNGNTRKSKSNSQTEIFDLTRTYPLEYYANNWWTIYEDILQNREEQFGSIDNWWNFYEAILNKKETTDEELKRIRAVVEYRNRMYKRPSSRMEEQLKMLDEIKNDKFHETEDFSTANNESVRIFRCLGPVYG